MKKSLNRFSKQSILAAIAVSCISIVTACQQPPAPTETATTVQPTASKPSAAPSSSPSPSTSASPSASTSPKSTESPSDKSSVSAVSIDKVVGEYKVVIDPKILAEAEKEGIKSVTGKWTIKADGTFDTALKAVSLKDEVQEIKTAGKIVIKEGKVVPQVELVNGEKPTQAIPEQPYTLSADGKELQIEGQPVKLVKQ